MGLEVRFDTNRSLVELGVATPEPDEFADHQAGMLYKLCTVPTRKLGPAELLALTRENVSLLHTVPLALARLEDDPFVQAAEHPGDLMTAILQTPPGFWEKHRALWEFTLILAANAVTAMSERMAEEGLGDYLPPYVGDDFMTALLHFRDIHGALK